MGGADGDLDDGTRCLQFSKKLALGLLLSLVIAVCWLLVIHSLKWVAMYGHAPHTHHYTHRPWPAPSSATLSWLPRTPTTTMTHDSAMGVSSTTEEGGTPPSSPLQDNERGEGGVTEVSMTRVQRDNYSDNKKNMVAKRLVAAVDSGNNDDNEDDDLVNTFVTAEHVHSFTTTQATLPTHRQRGLNEQSQQSLPRTTTMFGENNNNKVKKITTSTSNRPTEPDVVPSLRLSSIILGPTKPATTTTDQHNNQNNDANNNPRHNSNNNNNQEDHLDEILTRHNSKHDTEDITTATTAVTVTSALDNTISSDDLHNSARDTDNLSLSNNPNNDDSADNHSANAQHHKIHRRPRTHSSHIRYEAPFFTAWFCSVWNILFMPMFTLISTCCFRHEDTTTRKLVAESITQFMDHGLTSMQFIGRCAFFSLLWMATIYGLISSMAHIDATVVMSLFACSAIFVYILSWVVLHQQFVGVRIVAVIICTTGIALLAYMDNSHKTLGSVLVVTGSALSSAIYKVFYQRMFGFWSVAQMSLFFTLIGFLNAFLMWPIVLVLYFTGTEIIIWRDIPWLHLVAAGFLYLLADVVAYFGPICTYEVFLTFGLLLAVVMSAIVDVTYYKVTFAGMKLAGVLLLMIGFLVCLLPYNWNEFLCDMVNARIANWKKQRSLKKSRNKVQDLTTGHVSRLRTPSGRKANNYRQVNEAALCGLQSGESRAFQEWLQTSRLAKSSSQTQLPQSRLPVKHSLISETRAQLFLVIDTCSLCKYRAEFIEFVTETRKRFPVPSQCPLRLIMSLPVIEELDSARKSSQSHCPSQFVRFLEEEMRTNHVIIGEFDPSKASPIVAKNNNNNHSPQSDSDVDTNVTGNNITAHSRTSSRVAHIRVNDDRILDCCLRAQRYVKVRPHHRDTKVLLITEDNLFKVKATTYDVVSYRWAEFVAKYKNFGLEHFTATPRPIPRVVTLSNRIKKRRRRTIQRILSDSEDDNVENSQSSEIQIVKQIEPLIPEHDIVVRIVIGARNLHVLRIAAVDLENFTHQHTKQAIASANLEQKSKTNHLSSNDTERASKRTMAKWLKMADNGAN
ncbi:Solute carrier family 35 member F4, partial [Fragariocoptes setiger]